MANLVLNPLDPRCARTRQNIMRAFMDLAAREPADTITVSALVSLAGINRSTFYLHFRDTENLAEAILLDLCTVTNDTDVPEQSRANGDSPSIQETLQRKISSLVSETEGNRSSFLSLSKMDSFSRTQDVLVRRLARDFAAMHPDQPEAERDLFLATAITGILFYSLRNGFPRSDNLAEIISSSLSSFYFNKD